MNPPRPYPTTIKDWPEGERPRERLVARGAPSMGEAELLAIILRTGSARGGSALDLARGLLQRFGDLRALEEAGVAELCEVPGMGLAKAAQVKAALELGRRLLTRGASPTARFNTSEDVAGYLGPSLMGRRKEVFQVMLLNAKNQLLKVETVSEGSLTESVVHPREAFRPALRESAAAVVFVHNHPSGDPEPSRDDVQITRRLKETGDLLGIRVLDHLILGDGRYYSFADEGKL